MLFLKAIGTDRKTYDGFYYPNTVGEEVVAPDWDADPSITIGHGIYALPMGTGDISYADRVANVSYSHYYSYRNYQVLSWVVLESNGPFVDVGNGVWRMERATIRFISDRGHSQVIPSELSQYSAYLTQQKFIGMGTPAFDTYIHGVHANLLSVDTDGIISANPVWKFKYYDKTIHDWVEFQYRLTEDSHHFGNYTQISTDVIALTSTAALHRPRVFVCGNYSTIKIHFSKTSLTVGDDSYVEMNLGRAGYTCSLTTGNRCQAIIDKDNLCNFGDYCDIEHRGQKGMGAPSGMGPTINCGDGCKIKGMENAKIYCGDRCKITGRIFDGHLSCGVFCMATVAIGTTFTCGAGTVINVIQARSIQTANTKSYIVCNTYGVKPNTSYHVNEDGSLTNLDTGEIINDTETQGNVHPSAGVMSPLVSEMLGTYSFIEDYNNEAFETISDTTDVGLSLPGMLHPRDLFLKRWRKAIY